jgi:hypothetical protein
MMLLGAVLFLCFAAFSVFLHYRIVTKAGRHRWWSVATLLPMLPYLGAAAGLQGMTLLMGPLALAYLGLVWVFAFARWPRVDEPPVQRPQGPLQPPSEVERKDSRP